MRKLLVAIALALSLAFGGCATVGTTPDMTDTEATQTEQYTDMQLQGSEVVYKIPIVIGNLQDKTWRIRDQALGNNFHVLFFDKGNEAVSMLMKFDGKVVTIMALVYVKKVNDVVEAMYWIYNGKAYPKKVDKLEMDAYSKMLFNTR